MKQVIGIVGCEGNRFTAETEVEARRAIRSLLLQAKLVVSGACHKGGIDVWAEEEAHKKAVDIRVFPAHVHHWSKAGGYRDRNVKIVEACELLVCISTRRSAATGTEEDYCYHCCREDHVKSGGCWTMKHAKKLGKKVQLIIVG